MALQFAPHRLELLPLLATAIFAYRSQWLMQAPDAQRVDRILSNLSALKVMPLLQLFLWDREALTSYGSS